MANKTDDIQDMVDALQLADRCWKEEHVVIVAANAQVCIAIILNAIRKSLRKPISPEVLNAALNCEPLDRNKVHEKPSPERLQALKVEMSGSTERMYQKVVAMERLRELVEGGKYVIIDSFGGEIRIICDDSLCLDDAKIIRERMGKCYASFSEKDIPSGILNIKALDREPTVDMDDMYKQEKFELAREVNKGTDVSGYLENVLAMRRLQELLDGFVGIQIGKKDGYTIRLYRREGQMPAFEFSAETVSEAILNIEIDKGESNV